MMTFKQFQNSLTESPMLITEYQPEELVNIQKNKSLFKTISTSNKKEIFRVDENAVVYRYKNSLVCLDYKDECITYRMKFEINKNSKLGQFVWQSSLWRDINFINTKPLPKKMFFGYLLKEFPVVLTDSVQSFDGARFWVSRILDAFELNLHVYFYDFLNNNLIQINTVKEWDTFSRTNKTDIWGKTELHKLKRMIITSKTL